jgi:nitroreductase
MIQRLKDLIKVIIGNKIYNIIILQRNYLNDYIQFKRHSSIFKLDTFNKNESEITLRYHSIEKGFLHKPPRPRFAKKRVEDLIILLKEIELDKNCNRVQIQSALLSLCKYYDYHSKISVDISDYFVKEDYDIYKHLLILEVEPIKSYTKELYFQYKNSDFKIFSTSRASVRNFTGEKIDIHLLHKVINLANHAPSVCNRQPVNVHLVENKSLIDKILEIQGGLKGYSANLSQLIVLTSDRNFFYSVGERYQLYIDGGIYLMNLLYALHFYGIGACPAHWGMPYQADIKMTDLLNLKNSEQIISLIAVGVPTNEFNTTLSLRKSSDENLFIHN